jgi:thiamine biosynthesis lipoprotein
LSIRRFYEELFMSKKKRIASALAVLLVTAAGLAILQCHQKAQTSYTKDLFAMDTFFSMQAYGPKAQEGLEDCASRVEELEGLLSVTRVGSDIWNLNHRSDREVSDAKVVVGADTFALLEKATELGDETNGALDISLYPILKAWGFTTGEYRIPDENEIRTLLENVDYRKITLDKEASAVILPEGMELDLGAVAKGYTGDCLLALLKEEGVTSAMLNLGGNVQVLGTKPDGTPWRIAVKNPFDVESELGVLEVTDKAVITSGSYERFFTGEDGKDYWHILNPSDGCPADSGLVSVTVVGDSGVRCDGLSTALFVMGKDEAVRFWQQERDFEMILVTEEGHLYMTEGLADCFESSEGWYAEII